MTLARSTIRKLDAHPFEPTKWPASAPNYPNRPATPGTCGVESCGEGIGASVHVAKADFTTGPHPGQAGLPQGPLPVGHPYQAPKPAPGIVTSQPAPGQARPACASCGLAPGAAVHRPDYGLVLPEEPDSARTPNVKTEACRAESRAKTLSLKAQHEAIAGYIQKAEGGTIQQARAMAWSRNPKLMRAYNDAAAGQ